jgi:hypothetical protein
MSCEALDEEITMKNNVAETGNSRNKAVTPSLVTTSPVSSDVPSLFQVFFLTQDESQNVEVLETDEIDFGEVLQRLKMGENVFIKYKNQEIFCFHPRINKNKDKFWYFTHC